MKSQKQMQWSIITLLLLFLPLMGSCSGSSSDNDEPDDPNSSKELRSISPDILPGQWILETFTPDNGSAFSIDYPFTILPFAVKQESTNVVTDKGYQYWAENYNPFTQVITVEDVVDDYGTVGFVKAQGAGLSSSKVYELAFNLTDSEGSGSYIVVLADITFNNNVITAYSAAYNHYTSGSVTMPKTGKLTMRKIN